MAEDDTRLLHFSAEPFLGPVQSAVDRLTVARKPVGLWLSVGMAWAEWCLGQKFAVERLRHCAEIVLRPERILRLSSAVDIDRLSESSARSVAMRGSDLASILEQIPASDIDFRHHVTLLGYLGERPGMLLDWRRIAEAHDGIVIAPYQFSRRLTRWYCGWNCASGCIWRPEAVAEIRPIVEQA